MEKIYKLRYLPIFEQDLYEAAGYIANQLKNPQAAENLINLTEAAITKAVRTSAFF